MSQRIVFTRRVFFALIFALAQVGFVYAQTSSFTYQGRFTDGGTAANATYDMQFKLFDGSGNQISSTITNGAVPVTNGVFTVQLDYGAAAFPGADRFLELGVRTAGSGDAYTVLSPRQQLSSTPYAIRAGSSTTADTAANANQLGGVAANQYVQANDSRLTDSRSPSAGSSNYIQNTTSQQSANFNINGNGTAAGYLAANFMNAVHYDIGLTPFVSGPGLGNVFVGGNAGSSYTTGSDFNTFVGFNAGATNASGSTNTFVGAYAGQKSTGSADSFFGSGAGISNTTGNSNSIFGKESGSHNTTGSDNSFFGVTAGRENTMGDNNNFFGSGAGRQNTTGAENSYFGSGAGLLNKIGGSNSMFGLAAGFNNTASSNSFFGYKAGHENTTASGNSFFGSQSGFANTTGNSNSFFGSQVGFTNTTGANNSFFGAQAGLSNSVGGNNSFFGAFAGYLNTTNGAVAGANNSFFGAFAGQNNSTASDNSFFGNQAGKANTIGAQNSFFGSGAGQSNKGGQNSFFGALAGKNNSDGINNSYFGNNAGQSNTTGSQNTFVGDGAGFLTQTGSNNTFVGRAGGLTNTTGSSNTTLGNEADVSGGNLDHATAIGADAIVSTSSTIVLGRSNGADTVRVPGSLYVVALGAGGSTSLCRNIINQISTCSSSLRYKKNIQPFNGGLSVLNRLRPITFDWKQGGMHDLGFGAEEIAAVEPLLVTHNDKGEIEGVKYDRISAVLVNAVKEQQEQIKQQQAQIESLKRLVCARHRRASVCK